MCASPPGVNSASLRMPHQGQGIKSIALGLRNEDRGLWTQALALAFSQSSFLDPQSCFSVRHARCRGFVNQAPAREPLEAEILVERVRLAVRERMREHPAGAGSRLESARAPAAIHEQIIDRRLADDR